MPREGPKPLDLETVILRSPIVLQPGCRHRDS